MINAFLMNYMKNSIETGIKNHLRHAGQQIIGHYRTEKEKSVLELNLQKLEQEYAETIIDTDDFQRYYKYHDLTGRIQDYIHHTESMAQSEQRFLDGLADEYEQSRSSAAGTKLKSGDRNTVYEFMEKITDLCRQAEFNNADNNSHATAENQMQHTLVIEEKLDRMQSSLSHPAPCPIEKSKSAMIFQKKFHKRLFLEKEGGAELAQVYVSPKCREKSRKDETGVSCESADTDGIFDTINRFLKSSKDILIIEGVAGSGKSSLLAALSDRCDSSEYLYIALKDLIQEKTPFEFRRRLQEASGLDANDSDKILIMDGYDEINRHLEPGKFREDLKWCCERGHKIILTTRRGYLSAAEYSAVNWQRVDLLLFDEGQIRKWLARYRQKNPEMKQETFDALMEPPSDQQLDEIRRIPIMLYVIANRNINVRTVSCMGDLYERVFENLKRDKAGMTAAMLERHYSIAQKIAYHMYANDELQITSEAVEALCGEEFDKTFYSSVYIENSIIEGRSVLEFVHKSILEFFAAKWIYRNFTNAENMFSVLRETYISEEILEYLKYFYQKEQEVAEDVPDVSCGINMTERYVLGGFRRFLEKGVPHKSGWVSIETMESENSCLFYNFAVLQKEMLGRKRFLSDDFIEEQGKNLTFIVRTYLLAGFARPLLCRRIFRGEDLSALYAPSYLDFEDMDLSEIVWEQSVLKHVSFREKEMNDVIFRDMRIENCDFGFVLLENSLLENVAFDKESLKNLRMSNVTCRNMKMPRGSLEIRELHNSFLQNVKFEYNNLEKVNFGATEFREVSFRKVNFRQCKFKNAVFENVTFSNIKFTRCDFSGVTEGECMFEDCKVDAATRLSNVELFERSEMGR